MTEVPNKPSEPEKVTLMLHTNEEIIKHKVGLFNLAKGLGNVSSEPVRNFVFVSHTVRGKGRSKYGEEETPGVQRRSPR